jgi:hypothetical protein
VTGAGPSLSTIEKIGVNFVTSMDNQQGKVNPGFRIVTASEIGLLIGNDASGEFVAWRSMNRKGGSNK